MSEHDASEPDHRPPPGVPRWLWPPPGAEVVGIRIRESVSAEGEARYEVIEGEAPRAMHLRALAWLFEDHPIGRLPARGTVFQGEVLLEIARTEMPGGRVGHTYALNRGPLGAPELEAARGILERYAAHALALDRAPGASESSSSDDEGPQASASE